MKLSQLAAFAETARTGSFTEAALNLDVSQSSISHAIQSLEAELGIPLLERDRSGVSALTAAGRTVLAHVTAILDHRDAILREVRTPESTTTNRRLRVGSIRSFLSPHFLAGLVGNFQRTHPDLELTLFEGTVKEVAVWLETGVIDVGFLSVPADRLDCVRLTRDELVVAMSAERARHAPDAIPHESLWSEPLILEDGTCVPLVLQRAGLVADRFPLRVQFQASNASTALEMVREGLGVTILPRMMIPMHHDGLVVTPFTPPLFVELGLAIRSRESASPAARQFIEAATSWKWLQQPG
ncbi:MAG: LysR family transcriptional regulator [Thermomicrobiales bacterium]